MDKDAAAGEFDQTNGQVPGLEGDSDGTAESDTNSEAERDADRPGLIGRVLGDDERHRNGLDEE